VNGPLAYNAWARPVSARCVSAQCYPAGRGKTGEEGEGNGKKGTEGREFVLCLKKKKENSVPLLPSTVSPGDWPAGTSRNEKRLIFLLFPAHASKCFAPKTVPGMPWNYTVPLEVVDLPVPTL